MMIALLMMTLLAIGFVVWPLIHRAIFLNKKALLIDKRGILFLSISAISIAVFSWMSYQYWGSSQQIVRHTQHLNNMSVSEIIEKMEKHLAKQPNSAQGWYLLGKLYFHQAHYQLASNALKKAYQLRPDDLETKLYYAQALFFQKNPQAYQLLVEIVEKDPNETTAINLLALDAYQKKNYQQAIQYWEKLLDFYSTDSEDGKALLKMIALSQKKLVVTQY